MNCSTSKKVKPRLCFAVVLLAVVGCGKQYGDVSPRTYEYAKALYSIANREAVDRLNPISEKIDADEQSGELTGREADWLRDIVAEARSGEWDKAEKNARRILEEQVKR